MDCGLKILMSTHLHQREQRTINQTNRTSRSSRAQKRREVRELGNILSQKPLDPDSIGFDSDSVCALCAFACNKEPSSEELSAYTRTPKRKTVIRRLSFVIKCHLTTSPLHHFTISPPTAGPPNIPRQTRSAPSSGLRRTRSTTARSGRPSTIPASATRRRSACSRRRTC